MPNKQSIDYKDSYFDVKGNSMGQTKKILIVGIDGFTWTIGDRLIQDGFMPTLGALIQSGSYGYLKSVMPFETGPAWASFQTGCYPNKTGIFSFHAHDPNINTIRLNSYHDILAPTLWEILDHYGQKVISINMPLTSPPPKINGVIIPGLLCPELSDKTTHPSSVYELFIRPRPDYQAVNNTHRDTIEAFVRQSCVTEQVRCDVATAIMSRYPWDVLYYQIQSTDLLQHRYWSAMDPEANGYSDSDYTIAAEFYTACDTVLAELIEKAGPQTDILIVSDHGFTKQNTGLCLNRWLFEKGYLVLKDKDKTSWEKTKDRHRILEYMARSYGVIKKPICQSLSGLISRISPVRTPPFSELELLHLRQCIDVEHSKAFCLGAMAGLIYVNSDSSDPQDIASRIKKELLDDFGASANNPLITHIKTGFEEYGQSDSHIRVPDLVVEYIDGVMTIINPSESKYIRRYDELNKQPGTHARDGIFIFKGSGIKAGLKTKAEIVDILPTLMAHIGLPISSHLDGKVLLELFESQPCIQHNDFNVDKKDTANYSERDQAEVEKRLADLGYL